MMLVWNNLADPHLSAFSHFAWFSQTVTRKTFLRTRLPPSTSRRASLVPFVFSSDAAYTDDSEEPAEKATSAAAMLIVVY